MPLLNRSVNKNGYENANAYKQQKTGVMTGARGMYDGRKDKNKEKSVDDRFSPFTI
jgi:cobyrinic acid a,c-diamide synthase